MQNKYIYIISLFKEKTVDTTEDKQVKHNILNQWESMAFPKLKLFSSINSPPRSHLVCKLQQENFCAIADVT